MVLQHLLTRPRLLEAVGSRWSRRVVTIVGGPGFGKSTLLAQAMRENALDPRGEDVLVRCTADDGAVAAMVEAIDNGSGEQCVLVDDVHHLCRDDDGTRVLAELLRTAPPSVHFVLAGRDRVCGLAQARAAGSVLDIGEDLLAFSSPETAALAAQYDADERLVASMGGWPAPTMLAALAGLASAIEYVHEAVLDGLDERERAVLALAATIGAGAVGVLRDAVDGSVDVVDLLARVPRAEIGDDGDFVVHELWRRTLDDALDRTMVMRAVDGLVERACFDAAFRLCATGSDWARAAQVITAATGRGHVAISPAVLQPWLTLLPADRRDEPGGLLIRGTIGRIADPFAAATAELLERAVHGFRARGDVAGEVAAGAELVYVLRNQGRAAECVTFLARANELDAAGHAEAAVPAAVGRGFLADCLGDDARMVAELSAIPPHALDPHWQLVVDFRLMMGHLVLGNEPEMLAAAARCTALASTTKDRNALALARWWAGEPGPALAAIDIAAADSRTSAVDAVVLGTFVAVVLATSGRVDEARAQLELAEVATSSTAPLMRGALTWARATIAIAAGDEDRARAVIDDALALGPLDDPIGWRAAARWLPLAYVLVPAVRHDLDTRALGPLHRRRLDVARAVVWATESEPCAPVVGALNVRAVATIAPLPWAARVASALHARNVAGGRELTEVLYELYGEPARRALRAVATGATRRLADGARKLLGAVALAPRDTVRLAVLGPSELHVGGAVTSDAHWARGRVRSLLVYLALHGKAQRDQLVDALWPHLDAAAADRNLRVTLTYLNQILEPRRSAGEATFFVRQSATMLTMEGAPTFELDVHAFDASLERAEDLDRRGLPSVALEEYREALSLWRGHCLAELAFEDWAQPTCTRLTARYVRAAVRTAELCVAAGETGAARRYAAGALAEDEWCEPAHRALVAAALADGDRAGARRALAACDAMLGELGVEAEACTHALRARLVAS